VHAWYLALSLWIAAGGIPLALGEVSAEPSSPAEVKTEILLSGNREAADVAAKEKFLNLNFFAEGRGMHIPPGMIVGYSATAKTGIYDGLIGNRWGMNVLPDHRVAGLFDVNYKGMRVGVTGCVVCHSGKAAGQFIVGLGNKRFDIMRLGKDFRGLEKLNAALSFSGGEKREVETSAIRFAELMADDRIGNLTQGLVPVSLIRSWFYQQANLPVPQGMHRGAVKIPALWGYGLKREVGQFCEGYGDGTRAGWLLSAELTAGQTAETARRLRSKVEGAEDLFAAFLPPPYPFAIDYPAAGRGRKVFARNCRSCHGSYARDADDLPLYQAPRWIPHDVVRTDSDRLDSNTAAFARLVKQSPLGDLIRTKRPEQRSYFAPRLDGIWCRFPFLHNGSVPNIAALLTPPEERPAVFSLQDAGERGRFDEGRLGLTVPNERAVQRLLKRGKKGDRSVYDTRRPGQSNVGHNFGGSLGETEKADLIEYLKTL